MRNSGAESRRSGRQLVIRPRVAHLADPVVAPIVAALAKEVTFAPGDVIYRADEPADCFYTFARGDVELTVPGMPPWILNSQSAIGLLDVFADRPRASTATAATEVRAMKVDADDYLDLLEQHFELVMTAVSGIAERVHELNLSLAPDGGFVESAPSRRSVAPPVRRPLDLVQKIWTLRDSAVFKNANVQALVRMVDLAREVEVEAGGTLFHLGEAAGRFYLVAAGTVEARREAPDIVARFGRSDLVCGAGALGTADNQYTATACSPVLAFAFSEEDFFDVMEEHFELTRSVLAGLSLEYERLVIESERRDLPDSVR